MQLFELLGELVWRDASGSRAVTQVHYPVDVTYAIADVSLTGLASAVASITGCTLVKQRLTYKARPTATALASDSTPVTQCGVFIITNGDESHSAIVQVPGIKDSKLVTVGVDAGILIDASDSDVIAFENSLYDADMSDPFGNIVSFITTAYRQSRV